ncbi:gliding motility-associated C-terminal domain-containing protein [bacterium]|nr:gliding motility-associated C-terminal domain-containing protein [bacterium]
MKSSLIFVLILFAGWMQVISQSHEGTEFWLGYMEHRDINLNTKVLMITSNLDTQGKVEMPLLAWSESFSVNAGEVAIITLPRSAETIGSERINKTGIRIVSDDPVVVYAHQYYNARSEAALILPVQALGDAYYIMTYTGFTDGQGVDYPSQLLLVAQEDDTEVEITLSTKSKGGVAAGSIIKTVLSKGESYQVQSDAGETGDMTGTFVKGSKNLAVFGGARWTRVPRQCTFQDNLYEQMFPIQSWGKKFVMAPFKDTSYDIYRILASEDNTQVYRDNVLLTTLNRGEFIEKNISANPLFLAADKPILVAQYTVGSTCNSQASDRMGDPSMLLLSSIEQTRESVTLYSSRFENIELNYVNIIARTDDFPMIRFDGADITSLGEPVVTVVALPDFSYISLAVTDGPHHIESSGCGVIASAYGYGNLESYAYSAGASFRDLSGSPIPDGGCLNDTIFFDTGLPPQYIEAKWDFGEGSTSDQSQAWHIYTSLGSYDITLFTHNLCLDTYDTLQKTILVSLRNAVTAGKDTAVCAGSEVRLLSSDLTGSTFQWEGPDGYVSGEQNPLLTGLLPENSGAYGVVATYLGCATFPAFSYIDIHLPLPEFGPDTSFCPGEGEQINLTPGNFSSYLWNKGTERNTLEITMGGFYYVDVWDRLGCMGSDSITIEEKCPTRIYFPNAFSPNGDGKNDFFKLIAEDVEAYSFSIYNRWGKQVFSSSDPNASWDGTFGGQSCSEGVFVWQVAYDGYSKDRENYHYEQSGTVTLIR